MAEFICTLIFKISEYIHVYQLCVYMGVGGGRVWGWVVEVLLCGCVSDIYIYIRTGVRVS